MAPQPDAPPVAPPSTAPPPAAAPPAPPSSAPAPDPTASSTHTSPLPDDPSSSIPAASNPPPSSASPNTPPPIGPRVPSDENAEATDTGDENTEPSDEDGDEATPRKWPHRGFTVDAEIGMQGCVRRICSSSSHRAVPGFRIDGFLGSNIRGFVEIGFGGGWGTMGTRLPEDANALSLYGIDVAALEALIDATQGLLEFDLDSLIVRDARMRTTRIGPQLRVHFLPRGRFAAYIGTGVGYSLLRIHYTMNAGDPLRFDFHGIDVPIEAGGAYYVHPNIAVGLQFRYLWSRYLAVYIEHPQQRAGAPISLLNEAMPSADANLQNDLPQIWTLTAILRARI